MIAKRFFFCIHYSMEEYAPASTPLSERESAPVGIGRQGGCRVGWGGMLSVCGSGVLTAVPRRPEGACAMAFREAGSRIPYIQGDHRAYQAMGRARSPNVVSTQVSARFRAGRECCVSAVAGASKPRGYLPVAAQAFGHVTIHGGKVRSWLCACYQACRREPGGVTCVFFSRGGMGYRRHGSICDGTADRPRRQGGPPSAGGWWA